MILSPVSFGHAAALIARANRGFGVRVVSQVSRWEGFEVVLPEFEFDE